MRWVDSGCEIATGLVKASRQKEMLEMHTFEVWEFVTNETSKGKRAVRCKWVDRFKDGVCRSRLVAMEIAYDLIEKARLVPEF